MKGPSSGTLGSTCVRATLGAALALVLGVSPALAQATGTVVGVVRDAGTQRPLEAAQVFIGGTGVGSLSNAAGRFLLLNVPAGEVEVTATLVGYRTQTQTVTVTAGESVSVDFAMAQTAIALDQIVVTGTGQATEKRKLGNTIATIDAANLQEAPVGTFSEILSGREPGVVGLPSNGLTGEGARIRIRGSASLSQSNEPIIYIDGVRIDRSGGFGQGVSAGGAGSPSRLDDINPDAIARIEVLKGAAAATLYGSEASNGVIQIFTKAGQSGAPEWTLRSEFGTLSYDASRYKPNAGFARTAAQAATMNSVIGTNAQPFEVVEVPVVDHFLLDRGNYTTQSLGVSGGTSTITYYVNGRFQYENGPFGGEELCDVGCARDVNQKAQGSMSLNIFPVEKLRIRVNALYADTQHETPNNANNIYGVNSLAMFSKPELANCNASSVSGFMQCSGQGNATGTPSFGTLREAIQVETHQDVQHFTGSVSANYAFTDGLNADLTFGVDQVNQRSNEFKPFGYDIDGIIGDDTQGERSINDRNAEQITFDGKVNWSDDFSDDVSSALTLGAQGFIEEVNEEWGTGTIFPGPGFEVVGAGALESISEQFQQVVNAGFFLQEQVGWQDWAYFTVGGRLDFNSAFGETESGEFYPKASISIIPSAWDSWSMGGVSTLRLRAAVGRSGLQPGAFDKLTTFGSLSASTGPGISPNNLGNIDLRPEVATEWEVGGEIGFFNDRLGLDVTYWDRTTEDALVNRQFPFSGGFRSNQLVNIGELVASGWELSLRGLAYESRNFSLDLFANGSYLSEEVTDLGGAPPIKTGGTYTRYRNFIIEGAAPGAFFGAKLATVPAGSLPVDLDQDGVADTEAELLAALAGTFDIGGVQAPILMLADDDGDGDVFDHFLGKPTPDWQGAFGFDATIAQNFRLSSLLEYKAGNYQVSNLTDAFRQSNPLIGRNIRKTAEVESTMLNPASTPQQRLEALSVWVNELVALFPQSGVNMVEDADFLRWRELSLTYDVPVDFAERMGLNGAAVTLSGRNIGLWTKYSGIDPESTTSGRDGEGNLRDDNFILGTEGFSMPLPRRWTVAFRLNF